MVVASEYPVLIYTDHSALRTLLTSLDNDAHGRIARWQERLGEYDLQLLHRSAKIHLMGIADGLSCLPTRLMRECMVKDAEGLTPNLSSIIGVTALAIDVMVNSIAVQTLRGEEVFWDDRSREVVDGERVRQGGRKEARVYGLGLEKTVEEQVEGNREPEQEPELLKVAKDMMWRRWEKWLQSGMYEMVVQARLEEWEGEIGCRRMILGQSKRKRLQRTMRKYVRVDRVDPKLFYREKNGELASCVLEEDVSKVLRDLHEGHGHCAARITLG